MDDKSPDADETFKMALVSSVYNGIALWNEQRLEQVHSLFSTTHQP